MSTDRLRQRVRDFLAEAAPGQVPPTLDERLAWLRAWQRRCYEAGWVGHAWPAEFGGGDGSPDEQLVIDEEFARAGVPQFAGVIGLSVLGPALLEFGTADQKARHLRPVLSGEEIWCQGFSEPGAGSDLGSLRTSARLDGDDYVVTGQKTWTSWAQYASWCGLLVRTDPDAPKHAGITMLIVDMTSPGISVAPMEQLTGHREFSEVFFDEVRVPRSQVLGEPGQGWSIAMHAFGHERGTAAMRAQIRLAGLLDELAADVAAGVGDDGPLVEDSEALRTLGRRLVDVDVLKHHTERAVGGFLDGAAVGFESSTVKLLRNRTEQRLTASALDLLSPVWMAGSDDKRAAVWTERYLQSRPVSVYGGTEQIQRNIIASRILKLPRS